MSEKILEAIGPVDDLLNVSPDGTMKCANVVFLGEDPMNPESETFHISITSMNQNKEHEVFDNMLGKTIKVTVETI